MTVNYAEKYSKELNQAIKQGTVTSVLETDKVKFLDAKTIKVQTVTTSGYQDHSRTDGAKRGEVGNKTQALTLTQDRSVEFSVDVMDVDETNQGLSAGNITKVFLDENANPEVDAYRFSKFASVAEENGTSTEEDFEEVDSKDVFKRLKKDLSKVRKYGTAKTYVFVSSEVMNAIEDYKAEKGSVTLSDKLTGIETRVTDVDGFKVIEVFDEDRFYDKFDFTEGFVPTEDSNKLNWVIVSKPSTVVTVKLSSVNLYKPNTVGNMDAYLYQNRLYHDAFVLEGKESGVQVSVKVKEGTEQDV